MFGVFTGVIGRGTTALRERERVEREKKSQPLIKKKNISNGVDFLSHG